WAVHADDELPPGALPQRVLVDLPGFDPVQGQLTRCPPTATDTHRLRRERDGQAEELIPQLRDEVRHRLIEVRWDVQRAVDEVPLRRQRQIAGQTLQPGDRLL